MKGFSLSINLFKGILFSYEDKIHEQIQVASFKGKFCLLFSHALQVFDRGFLQEISHFNRKEWSIKPVKLLNLIGHIGNEIRQFSISLLGYSGSSIFTSNRPFIDSPGMILGNMIYYKL